MRFIAFIISRCIFRLIPYGVTADNKLGNAIGFIASADRPDTFSDVFTVPASVADDAPPAPSAAARAPADRPRARVRAFVAHRVTARVACIARIDVTEAKKILFTTAPLALDEQSSRALE